MNAFREAFLGATLAVGVLGFAALSYSTGVDASGASAEDVCQVECLEALYESELVHVFYVDAGGKRHHLSTSLRSEEQTVLTGPKAAQVSPNLVRVHVMPSESPKSLGCGADGYGWDAGELMWSREISNTSGPGGSTRTDARSIYLARGRATLFTTTTQIPATTGIPTSTTSTSEVPASRRAGTPRGCQQAE